MSPPRRPLLERLEARIEIDEESGCWVWTGHLCKGYGSVRIPDGKGRGRAKLVHRASYELLVDPIPDGLTLDHLCRNRACINPDHLEPVTLRENTLRGETITAVNARKTHCIHGHPFNEENTYLYRGRFRFCRACTRAKTRRWYEANKEQRRAYAREKYRRALLASGPDREAEA